MFGGKILLKWNDPRTLEWHEAQAIPLWQRVWGEKNVWVGGSPSDGLLAAVLLYIAYTVWAVIVGPDWPALPDFGTGWVALLGEMGVLAIVWLLFLTVIVMPIAYLLKLAPQPIQIRERAISHFGRSKRWPFTRLGAYSVQSLEAGEEHIRVLALYNHSGELKVGLEIAPEVSDEQIAEALRGRLPHRSEFEPQPGYMHRL